MADIVLALDLGERTGIAYGPPGQPPETDAIYLKDRREGQEVGFAALMHWLERELGGPERPSLVVVEGLIPLKGLQRLGTAETTVRFHYGMHAIVAGCCYRGQVRLHDVTIDTVRVHFIGRRNCGSREETKRAVMTRAHQLGFLSLEHFAVADDDRADAIAVWDWACATLLRKAPRVLQLFGGKDA